jgi:ribose transport system substrate-binding protein
LGRTDSRPERLQTGTKSGTVLRPLPKYPQTIKQELRMSLITDALARLPLVDARPPRTIGYVVNFSFHIWYTVVENYMRARAAQYGIDEVTVLDANLDIATELAAVDQLLSMEVDLLIVTPVAAPGVEAIVTKAAAANVPLVLEANPVPGMTTMVAICDYDAGFKSGKWAGDFVKEHLGNRAHLLDIAFPPLRPCLLRSEGFLDGLRSVVPQTSLVARVNGQARVDVARDCTLEMLTKHPEINVVFGMDDESTHGGLEAVQKLGIDDSKIMLFGFGLAGDEDKSRLQKPSPWKASLAMFPEWVGLRCVDQGVRVFNGQHVNQHDVVPTIPVSPETLTTYFAKRAGEWTPNLRAIASLPLEDRCTKT